MADIVCGKNILIEISTLTHELMSMESYRLG